MQGWDTKSACLELNPVANRFLICRHGWIELLLGYLCKSWFVLLFVMLHFKSTEETVDVRFCLVGFVTGT